MICILHCYCFKCHHEWVTENKEGNCDQCGTKSFLLTKIEWNYVNEDMNENSLLKETI